MAYSTDGKIEADDINNLTANVNSVLTSLGQTNLSSVTQNNKIFGTEWQNLINKVNTIANHQNTVITALPSTVNAVAIGKPIEYYLQLTKAIDSINENKKNAKEQGTVVTNYSEASTTWSNKLTFTQTITFANATAASNYFNAGGQIALQFLHPANTNPIDTLFNKLATDSGTIVLSGHTSGNAIITGTTYSGVTKIGGGGSSPTIYPNLGYNGLTTVPQSIFKQIGSTYVNSYGGLYNQNFIEVKAYTSSGGATINFETVWDEVPNGLVTGTGNVNGRTKTTTYLLVKYPSTTYIANSWSSTSFTGSVSGS